MASTLASVPWDDCLLEPRRDRDLERLSRNRLGVVMPALPYLVSRPWVARSLVTWQPECGLVSHLDLAIGDLVALTVSQQNACRFCYATTRTMLRILGLSESRVREIERQIATEDLDPRTLAALRYARTLSRAAPMPGAAERDAVLGAGFSAAEFRELAFVIAFVELANRLHTLVAVPPGSIERLSVSRFIDLVRPLTRAFFGRYRRPGEALTTPTVQAGPYARLLAEFADSPIAPAVAETVASMTASAVLPPRARSLIFAVVAHALGCPLSAQEARAMLPPDADTLELDQALAHLGGQHLDPLETAAVRFARDTIWYTPLDVQRRGRELLRVLSVEQFVEVVGIASLANALCRLSAAVLSP